MEDPDARKPFLIRNATADDLEAILVVEQNWPEHQRAGIDKFRSRLERFPEGFWVAESEGTLAGVSTSCPARYDPEDMRGFKSWNLVTNNGYLYPPGRVKNPNALYVVSTVTEKSYRGKGLLQAFFRNYQAMTHRLGLPYSLTGATLPGYGRYLDQYAYVPADEYAFLRQNGKPLDWLVRSLAEVDFRLPDKRHVIPGYYPDADSLNFSALLVYRNTSESFLESFRDQSGR